MSYDNVTSPASLKYAHIERERRFLLQKRPTGIAVGRELWIQDRYLIGSTLRLRRVEEIGLPTQYKLGQKIRIDNFSPLKVAHTTMYLSEAEFDILATLPAKTLEKTRLVIPVGDLMLALDEFGDRLAGLFLAEIDLGVAGLMPELHPIELVTEVTDDERFTGGALSDTTKDDLFQLLMDYGVK